MGNPQATPPAQRVSAPAPGSAASAAGAADQLRLLAAAVIVVGWTATTRPLDWSLEEFVGKVKDVALRLR